MGGTQGRVPVVALPTGIADAEANAHGANPDAVDAHDEHNVVNQCVVQPCGDNVVQSWKDNAVHGGNGDDEIRQEGRPCDHRAGFVLVSREYLGEYPASESPEDSWMSKLGDDRHLGPSHRSASWFGPINQAPNNEKFVYWQYWCKVERAWLNCFWRWNDLLAKRKNAGERMVEVWQGSCRCNDAKKYIVDLHQLILTHETASGEVETWPLRKVEEVGPVWGLDWYGRLYKIQYNDIKGGEFVWQVNMADRTALPLFRTLPPAMQSQLNMAVRHDPNLTKAKARYSWRTPQGNSKTAEYIFDFDTMEQLDLESSTKRKFRKMCLRIVQQNLIPHPQDIWVDS